MTAIEGLQVINDLGRAYREGRLDRRMRVYLAPKVLIIDEMGYLPLDDLGATIFFQLISARYERGSIIVTSNKSYGDWGSIFGDIESIPPIHQVPRLRLFPTSYVVFLCTAQCSLSAFAAVSGDFGPVFPFTRPETAPDARFLEPFAAPR